MMKSNFHERYELRDLAFSLGCLISPSPMISARNDGNDDTFSLRISDEQMLEFLGDKEFSSLYSGRAAFGDHQFYLGLEDITLAPPCYAGFNTCAITPAGKVLPCNQLLLEVGDLQRTSFKEVWTNSPQLAVLRSLILRDLQTCIKCELLRSCSRCPGLALLENGDLMGPSPENCRISRLRVI